MFGWDEEKRRRNLVLHGIDFETAKLVFEVRFSKRSTTGRTMARPASTLWARLTPLSFM